jgi:hypothetical protein
MYSRQRGLVLGFHGCDSSVSKLVISGDQELKPSINSFDWLGHGIYFWENSISRAEEYAIKLKVNPKQSKHPIIDPSVIGGVLDLGYCLDLTDYRNLSFLKDAYEILLGTYVSGNLQCTKNGK